jgi:hypothetical protein
MARYWSLVFLTLLSFSPRAFAFDLDLVGNNSTLVWDTVFAHEYQLLWGSQVTQVDQPRGRVLTAIDTNRSSPVAPEGVQGFWGVADHGWAFKMLLLTNAGSGGAAYFTWSSQSDDVYRVQRVSDLNESPVTLASGIPANYPVNSFTDSAAGGGPYFYWVERDTNGGYEKTRNAVGFYVVAVTAGLNLCSSSFENPIGDPPVPSRVFRSQLTIGSTCFVQAADVYNSSATNFYVSERFTATGWNPDTNEFSCSRGFYISLKNTSGLPLYVCGEVPSAAMAITINTGFTHLGYPYAVSVIWTSTALATQAVQNDSMYWWSPRDQVYRATMFDSGAGWIPATVVVARGMGFAYYSHATQTTVWIEPKPYTWP